MVIQWPADDLEPRKGRYPNPEVFVFGVLQGSFHTAGYYFRRGERDVGFFFEVSIGTRTYLNLGLTALTFPFSYMIKDVLVQADFSMAFFTPSLWAFKSI